ncbi:hypothetical protein ABW02_01925 [Niallia circulans]|uniref:Uncharacterized protein n=1 Tax=Niallia circulans TaxID=1397 RepID=A0A0J1IRC8_NIACI|nr:hypothetical protein [Niallia circulans]KLV28516.1 hypothetical protein ABW02_01925 [Niallia circulans]MED5099453.1 hypothetical protein [Niallia circulans]PAE13974.1 hypothetical protein CHI02_01910 [Niallia circulans]
MLLFYAVDIIPLCLFVYFFARLRRLLLIHHGKESYRDAPTEKRAMLGQAPTNASALANTDTGGKHQQIIVLQQITSSAWRQREMHRSGTMEVHLVLSAKLLCF